MACIINITIGVTKKGDFINDLLKEDSKDDIFPITLELDCGHSLTINEEDTHNVVDTLKCSHNNYPLQFPE